MLNGLHFSHWHTVWAYRRMGSAVRGVTKRGALETLMLMGVRRQELLQNAGGKPGHEYGNAPHTKPLTGIFVIDHPQLS